MTKEYVVDSIMPKEARLSPRRLVREVLADEDSFTTTLLILCFDIFWDHRDEDGNFAFVSWHPAVIAMEIEQRYNVTLPKVNLDKIMAGVSLLTTDLFFKNLDRFIKLANVLAGDDFDPTEFEPADALECAWAISEALILVPAEDDDPDTFADEIRHYVAFVLRDEGFVTPPDVLRIALDADYKARVFAQFADDPDALNAIGAGQDEKAKEVTDTIRENLLELAGQLEALQLQHGDTSEVVGRIYDAYRRTQRDAETPEEGLPESSLLRPFRPGRE
jgi:hypothetical protein